MDRSRPFTTLARVVATLAAGKPVTTPFAMGQRRTEWSETFELGIDRIDRETCVLHSSTTRRDGVVRKQMSDPCFWSLTDMFEQVREWSDDDFAAIEPTLEQLSPGRSVTLDVIAALDDHQTMGVTIVTTIWQLTQVDGAPKLTIRDGCDPKWTLDEVVRAVIQGR